MRCLLLMFVLGGVVFDGSASAQGVEKAQPYDVRHDGYRGGAPAVETARARSYVVVETESAETTEYEGEPVLVVKEPEPVAATSDAPPPPKVARSEEMVRECPSGVWVHGYWEYRDGQYIWVDGHCTQVRVDYVFVAPRWDFYWDIWWFMPGYYRPCGTFVTYGYYRPWHWFPPYPNPYYPAGRPIPESRGTPARPTTTRPAPGAPSAQVTRAGRYPPKVIQTPPSSTKRTVALGRTRTGSATADEGVRSGRSAEIVTEARGDSARAVSLGTRRSGRSRGIYRERSRTQPSSSGSVWKSRSKPSFGPSRSWGGGRSRSTPSSGSRSGARRK